MEIELKIDNASQEMAYYSKRTAFVEWEEFKAKYIKLRDSNKSKLGDKDGEDFFLIKDRRNNCVVISYLGWVLIYRPRNTTDDTFGKRIMELEGL